MARDRQLVISQKASKKSHHLQKFGADPFLCLRGENLQRGQKMPEKSRGKKTTGGTRKATDKPKKNVSFETDSMDLDEKFEELTKPVYKGKKLDDPIRTPAV